MLLGFFLAVKDSTFDAFDLHNRAEPIRAEDRALRVYAASRTARQLLLRFNQGGDDEILKRFFACQLFF